MLSFPVEQLCLFSFNKALAYFFSKSISKRFCFLDLFLLSQSSPYGSGESWHDVVLRFKGNYQNMLISVSEIENKSFSRHSSSMYMYFKLTPMWISVATNKITWLTMPNMGRSRSVMSLRTGCI